EIGDAEVDAYVERNVAAVRDVAARVAPEAALANHLVMGPLILARAGVPCAVKVHGSALEYVVKADPERFLPAAREGLADARSAAGGAGGSRWGGRPARARCARRRASARRASTSGSSGRSSPSPPPSAWRPSPSAWRAPRRRPAAATPSRSTPPRPAGRSPRST